MNLNHLTRVHRAASGLSLPRVGGRARRLLQRTRVWGWLCAAPVPSGRLFLTTQNDERKVTHMGVIQRERERQEGWEQLGLTDPVGVVSAERLTMLLFGVTVESPGRPALENYYDEHPEVTPPAGFTRVTPERRRANPYVTSTGYAPGEETRVGKGVGNV
jgi:hypothetical protein